MSGIKLDINGDIDITDGKFSLTTGVDAIAQRLKQRLGLFLGEWFLDKSRGLPYIQQILVKNPNPTVIDSIFKNEILSEVAVKELTSFELDLDEPTRLLTVNFSAKTDDGPLDFSEAFGI